MEPVPEKAWRLVRRLRAVEGDALCTEIAEALGEHLHALSGTGLPWRLADALPAPPGARLPACGVATLVGPEGRGGFAPTASVRVFCARLEAAAPFLTGLPLRATGGALVLAGAAVMGLLQKPVTPAPPFELFLLGACTGAGAGAEGTEAAAALEAHLRAAWGERFRVRRTTAGAAFREKGGSGAVDLHAVPRPDPARLLGELGLGAAGALFNGRAVLLSGPGRLLLERRLLLHPPGLPLREGARAAGLFGAGYDLAFPGAPPGFLPPGLVASGARRLRAHAAYAEDLTWLAPREAEGSP